MSGTHPMGTVAAEATAVELVSREKVGRGHLIFCTC